MKLRQGFFKKSRLTAVLTAALLLMSMSGCSAGADVPERRTQTYFEYFDTVSQVIGYEDDEQEFDRICGIVSEMLDKYHRLSDIYHRYDGINNLYTINHAAGEEPVEVDEELIDMLLIASEMAEVTDGYFDISTGSVLSIWHDCREEAEDDPQNAHIPSAEELSGASLHTGMDKVIIDQEAATVYLSDPEMSLDVGGIAKGYAVEKIAQTLEAEGVSGYILNIGGNLRSIGKKGDGEDWVAGIQNPDLDEDSPYVCRVGFHDLSLVTSGDYQRYYMVDGVRYHHIINPYTLMPEHEYRSVSVLCRDSCIADCLSTALFNMSIEDGRKLAEKVGDVDVFWIKADGSFEMTDGFKDKMLD